MKNNFLHLSNAKAIRNTGGGSSRCEASIIAGQYSQRKTMTLEGSSNQHLVSIQSASNQHPISIRSASDGTRWQSRGWKYAACLLLAFVLGIGQMWGADKSATTSLNLSNLTSSNWGSWSDGTPIISGDYFKISAYMGRTSSSQSWIGYTGGNNGDYNSGNGWSSTGKFAGSDALSATSKYMAMQQSRSMYFRVTGCKAVYALVQNTKSGSTYRRTTISAFEYTTSRAASASATMTSSDNSTTVEEISVTGLDAAKTYEILLAGTESNNAYLMELVFEKSSSTLDPSATPSITAQPSTTAANYIKDASATALSVTASNGGVGTLTYQWYKNTTNSNASGSAISGATSASYTPSTAETGTWYYYCAVTNTETSKSPTTVKSNVSGAITTQLNPVGEGHVLTWNLVVRESGSGESTLGTATTDIGTSSKSSTSSYLTTLTDLAGVGVKRTTDGKSNNTGKIETPASYDADKYVSMSFAVADGYQFTPTAVSIKTVAVYTAKDLKFEFNDASNSYSVTKTGLSTSGTAATNNLDFSSCDKAFTGTVTVKIYVYGAENQYRLSTPLTITGDVAAVVAPSGYTVTYNASSGSGDVPTDGTSYSSGATVTVKGNIGSTPLSRSILGAPATFLGWNTNSDMHSGTHYNPGETFNITSNTTLYAVWGFNITYTDEDKSTEITGLEPTYYIYGQGATLPTTPSAPTGYDFGGWYNAWCVDEEDTGDSPCGGSAPCGFDDTHCKTTAIGTTDTWDAEYYAKWTAKTAIITLNKDGGEGGSASVTATYDAAMPSAGDAPTKSGCSFQGYWTAQAGTGTRYYDATPASVKNSDFASAATLYAAWKLNDPEISCTDNTITMTEPAEATVYYTTDGSTPTSGSTAYNSSSKPVIAANTTFKAIAIKENHISSNVVTYEASYVNPSTKRIYMKCGSTWCDDVDAAAPTFFTHSWDGSTTANSTVMQHPSACETDVYYADIPASHTYIIFTRQKAGSTELAWSGDNFVNQSVDITIGDNDLFTCTGWSDGKGTFAGSTYAAPTYSISFAGNGNTSGEMSAIENLACGANQAITANAFVKAGYSFANWTANVDVTVGEATITAGSAISAGATLKNITSDITLTAAWTQEMPTSVSVDGGWRYFPGQTITLTATPTGGTSGFTYQWQKYVTDAWQDIDGADEAIYTKANCTISDCGSYRCIVSKLGGSVASGGYDVHIYTLNGNYDGSDWVSNNLTLVSGTTGTVELSLEAGRLYEFKVKDNFNNYWFGNSGYMLKSESSWTCPSNVDSDIRVFTGAAGTYTFTVDIEHTDYGTPQVAVSVTYPSVTHPAAGYVYYDKGTNDWANIAAHWWKNEGTIDFVAWNSDPWLTQSVEICGTTYYYMPKLEGYDRVIFHKPSASGEGNQTPDITVDASSSGKYISGNSTEWTAFAKYTISFEGNGNTSGEMSAIANICPAADQALTANAFAKTGHNFTGWVADVDVTVGESTITAGNLIEDAVTLKNINSNIALTAQWESNCPATGTLFAISSIVASQTYSNVNSTNMLDLSATYTNGSAKVGSTGSTGRNVTTSTTGELSFNANGDVCVKLLLDCELAEGDIIFYTSSDNKELRLYATSGGSYVTTAAKSYTIPAESPLIGKQELWILRDNSGSLLQTLTISRPATITLDATTNGGTAVDPVSGIVGNKVVLPHAFKSGKRFKGWYTDASAGTKQADYYTISASTTLYAQFEDIPASGTMFSLALEDALKPASNVTVKNAAGFVQPQDMIQYATVSGGSAIVYNSSTSDHAIITTTPTLKFAGGNAYLLITFESALQEGDVITTTISGQNISYTTTSTRSTANNFIKGTDQTLTITDGHALEGATAIYLWAASSSNGELTSLVVERPTTYALAWDFGGGTCSATAGEDYTAAGSYVAGTAITYPADNTMSRDDYTFEGWSSDATVMPTGNLTITAQWTAICYATAPGTISKGTVSSGTLTLNAAGSPADNNTWYWQTSESGTSTANSGASFDVTAAGTYYVRSYYSTGDCWSDAQSIVVEADDLLEHYAITYDKGEHGTGSIEADAKTENVAVTLSDERFTRAGYLQTGWATTDGGAQAYALGASYTANAAITLFPVWTALDTYEASFACADAAPAGWTFSTDDGWADNKTIAAYVCKFTENGVSAPSSNSMDENWVAFAKNADAIATYDLGVTTTVAAMNVTLYGGSSSAFDETIEYLGADGSTVKKTYTNSLSAGNWAANNISKTDVVEDVRYIRVHGARKWVVMKDFSIKYIETRTKYNVTFAAGTGASGSMDAVQYIAGAEVTLPACTFTAPTCKEFDAWVVTKTAGGEDVSVTDGKFTMPAEAVTATATWKDAITRYTVAYYDGASKLGEEDVVEGENPVDFADYQTKEGYNFVGWYNNSDLANEHAVADIATEVINADANYYGKWALDLQVSKIVFSNGFDAFIKNNTVKAYYMAGESAPTITSYEGTNLKAEGGVTISGDKIVLTGTDDSEIEYDLTLEAVTPMTSYDKQTFDGTETYVKTGYTFTAERGWRISKDVEEASNKRVSEGQCRIYFFLGGGADKATLRSYKNRPVKIYVNNVETSITSVPESATFDIPLDPNDTKNMIAIVSNGSNGDGGFFDVKLNEHIISSDASLSSLTVNGNAVDLASGELVAGVMTYKYELPYGTEDAPTVAAEANDAFAELGVITQAASTSGTATFTVTAEDASTQAYAVKFSVSRAPVLTIYDGKTSDPMSSIANPGSLTPGLEWTITDANTTNASSASAMTFDGKSYTKYVNVFGSATQAPDAGNKRYMTITIPENYLAKFRLVGCGNGTGDRSLFISKEITSEVDESIAFVSTTSATINGMTSDFQFPGTYYLCCNASIRIYELSVTLYPIDYSRDVTQGRYGTICLPNGGIMVGATIFEVAYMTYENAQPYKVFFDEVIDGVMEPGMPYIFLPDEDVSSIAITYTDNANASAGNYNGLYGTLEYMDGEALYGKYIFSNNSIFMSEYSGNWLNANRAYIVLSQVPDYVTPIASNRRRVSMGVNGTNSATGMDEIEANETPMKVMIEGQIFIIRGEKMYDVTGKLVK